MARKRFSNRTTHPDPFSGEIDDWLQVRHPQNGSILMEYSLKALAVRRVVKGEQIVLFLETGSVYYQPTRQTRNEPTE